MKEKRGNEEAATGSFSFEKLFDKDKIMKRYDEIYERHGVGHAPKKQGDDDEGPPIVRICNLAKKPDLNGRTGLAKGWVKAKERYAVEVSIDGKKESFLLKQANLRD